MSMTPFGAWERRVVRQCMRGPVGHPKLKLHPVQRKVVRQTYQMSRHIFVLPANLQPSFPSRSVYTKKIRLGRLLLL